jgi:hypothetical protein
LKRNLLEKKITDLILYKIVEESLILKNAEGKIARHEQGALSKRFFRFFSLSRSKHTDHRQNQMCRFVALKNRHLSPLSRIPFTF